MPPAVGVLPLELHGVITELLIRQKGALYDEQDICRDVAALMLVGNENFSDLGRALAQQLCPHEGDAKLGAPRQRAGSSPQATSTG
jgi:hypothetical protein